MLKIGMSKSCRLREYWGGHAPRSGTHQGVGTELARGLPVQLAPGGGHRPGGGHCISQGWALVEHQGVGTVLAPGVGTELASGGGH